MEYYTLRKEIKKESNNNMNIDLEKFEFKKFKVDPNHVKTQYANKIVNRFFEELKENKEDKGELWEYKDDIIKLIVISSAMKEMIGEPVNDNEINQNG